MYFLTFFFTNLFDDFFYEFFDAFLEFFDKVFLLRILFMNIFTIFDSFFVVVFDKL